MSDNRLFDTDPDEASRRRERVVSSVLSRIATAPPRASSRRQLIDLAVWTIPGLAAAVVIIVISLASLVRSVGTERGPETVSEALGVSPPLRNFVATGEVDTWRWLYSGRSVR